MFKFFAIIFIALIASFSQPGQGVAQNCQNSSYWIFKIERKSQALSTSRDLNGVYRVECKGGTLEADNGDTQYFSDTVPSVVGLTGKIPWFCKELACPYSFEYESGKRKYQVSGVIKVGAWETITVPAGTFDAKKIIAEDFGHRAGTRTHIYFVSEQTASVIRADIHYASGTAYKIELLEKGP